MGGGLSVAFLNFVKMYLLHLNEVAGHSDPLLFQAICSGSLIAGFFSMALIVRLKGPLSSQPRVTSLTFLGCAFGAMLLLAPGSAASTTVPAVILCGFASGAACIAWWERYAACARSDAYYLLAGSALVGSVVDAGLFASSFLWSAAPPLLLVGVSFASLCLYRKTSRVCSGDRTEAAIARQQKPYLIPGSIVGALVGFLFVFGFMAGVSGSFMSRAASDVLCVGPEFVGTALASMVLLILVRQLIHVSEATITASDCSVAFLVVGMLLLPWAVGGIPFASNVLFVAGFNVFLLFMATVYFEISWKVPELFSIVAAQGLAVSQLASCAGFAVATVLAQHVEGFLGSAGLAAATALSFTLLYTTRLTLLNNHQMLTLWGLLSFDEDKVERSRRAPFEELLGKLGDEYGLTDREREVFSMLARGYRVAQIQDAFTISYSTVRTHINHIYTKMGIHTYNDLSKLIAEAKQRL
ncbi:LuxR C-terminal-related transcriptional regulator [Adlercreutzia sp. R25]|uniref:helix-turn-helix transcriptional regulator n=1 Tax=Adlercreutzia shanghongiae TaxID=3111773 RepID=UPI002DB86F3C|nr:LuxR C-terminal-related transcriptional regulator [Adlercreutzia sp. R25]MEC4272353.1 LuxR C-terminal-related transcriptional regulator [Adlercreutzia sp. R25]